MKNPYIKALGLSPGNEKLHVTWEQAFPPWLRWRNWGNFQKGFVESFKNDPSNSVALGSDASPLPSDPSQGELSTANQYDANVLSTTEDQPKYGLDNQPLTKVADEENRGKDSTRFSDSDKENYDDQIY